MMAYLIIIRKKMPRNSKMIYSMIIIAACVILFLKWYLVDSQDLVNFSATQSNLFLLLVAIIIVAIGFKIRAK